MDFQFSISKRMEIAGSHQLSLDYDSKCRNIHGHNWIIVVYCGANHLNHNGMIIDFKHIKNLIHDRLDHRHINDIITDMNPTAENMAAWILDGADGVCYKVTVQESEGNIACCTLGGCGGKL